MVCSELTKRIKQWQIQFCYLLSEYQINSFRSSIKQNTLKPLTLHSPKYVKSMLKRNTFVTLTVE